MRTLIWSNTFIRAFRRLIRRSPESHQEIEVTLNLLVQDPFSPQLKTHKLKGKLQGSWACSVHQDLRVVFDFIKAEKGEKDEIFLIEIGSHDEVY